MESSSSRFFTDTHTGGFQIDLPPLFHYDSSHLSSTPWSENENRMLRNFYDSATEDSSMKDEIIWENISNRLKSHSKSPIECMMQYRNVINPLINNGHWTHNEESKLLELTKKYDEHFWCEISEELNSGRTPIECLRHYQRCLNKSMIKSDDWDNEEDETLLEATRLYGLSRWQHVANAVPGRTSIQCQRRYRKLVPGLESGPWTDMQERRLVLALLAFPPTTATDAAAPGLSTMSSGINDTMHRSDNVPDGVHSNVTETAPVRRKSKGMTKMSDTADWERGIWAEVSKLVPGKDQDKCREKWVNVVDPMVDRTPFRPEEDSIILEEVDRHQGASSGNKQKPVPWTLIATKLPYRTDNQVWMRWRQLQDKQQVSRYRSESRKRKRVLPSKLGRKFAQTSVDVDDFGLVMRVPLTAHLNCSEDDGLTYIGNECM